jgi:hypothetical protein
MFAHHLNLVNYERKKTFTKDPALNSVKHSIWILDDQDIPLPSQATTFTLSTLTVSGRSLNSTLLSTNVHTLSQNL